MRAGALLEELGHPEKTLKIIHVAGSNGKGSVCAYLNRILIQHGFRTGLFTSPHLVDVRERIRIDNEMVSKSDFVQAFDRVHSAAKRLQKKNITLAYFDWLFGMALLLFVQKQADFVILETGLGGRLDATNAVQNPVVNSPITYDTLLPYWLSQYYRNKYSPPLAAKHHKSISLMLFFPHHFLPTVHTHHLQMYN